MPILRTAAWLAALLAATCASAQTGYPSRPIKLIVPYTPAGATDIVTRLVADRVGAATGWTIVVENRPGAGGNIGLDAVAKSKPDGYTLGMGQTSNLAINPALYGKMPYNALTDFTPVALVAEQPVVFVVRSDSPWRTLADLVAAAKVKSLNMASAAAGTVGHLAGELFARRAGIKITNVPYKGAAPALTDLMGGQTDFMLPTPQAAIPLLKGGKLRALAVTSAKRLPVLPDVPTVAEAGYKDFEAIDWKVLVAPAGAPADIVKRWHDEVDKALQQPETLDRLHAEGSTPMRGSPAQIAQFLKAEYDRWGTVVRDAGVKLE